MTGEREQELQEPQEPQQPQEPARNDNSDAATQARETRRDEPPRETGGPKGLEPTRYGDWERGGRCVDF